MAFQEVGLRASIQGLSGYLRGVDQIEQKTSRLGGVLKTAVGTALGFGGAQLVMGGVSKVFGLVGNSIIGMNAQLETSTLQFETLFKDADRAKKHVETLFEFAAKTPFETGPIIQASRIMQTFGGDALNTEENLRRVGDAAAVANIPINEVGFWIGRAYSAIKNGQPFGEAAMRLQEMAILSGETRLKMEQLQKSGAASTEIWNLFAAELDKTKGAMEKQAGTFAGLSSTITDAIQLTSATAFKPLFDLIKDIQAALVEFLGSEKFTAWGERTAVALQNLIDKGRPVVSDFFKKLLDQLRDADSPLRQLISNLLDLAKSFGRLAVGIGMVTAVGVLPLLLRLFGPLLDLISRSDLALRLLASAFLSIKLVGFITQITALTGAMVGLNVATGAGVAAIGGPAGLLFVLTTLSLTIGSLVMTSETARNRIITAFVGWINPVIDGLNLVLEGISKVTIGLFDLGRVKPLAAPTPPTTAEALKFLQGIFPPEEALFGSGNLERLASGLSMIAKLGGTAASKEAMWNTIADVLFPEGVKTAAQAQVVANIREAFSAFLEVAEETMKEEVPTAQKAVAHAVAPLGDVGLPMEAVAAGAASTAGDVKKDAAAAERDFASAVQSVTQAIQGWVDLVKDLPDKAKVNLPALRRFIDTLSTTVKYFIERTASIKLKRAEIAGGVAEASQSIAQAVGVLLDVFEGVSELPLNALATARRAVDIVVDILKTFAKAFRSSRIKEGKRALLQELSELAAPILSAVGTLFSFGEGELSKSLGSRVRRSIDILQEAVRFFIEAVKRIRLRSVEKVFAVASMAGSIMDAVGAVFSLEEANIPRGIRSRIRTAIDIIQEAVSLFIKSIRRIRIRSSQKVSAIAGAAGDLMGAIGAVFSLEEGKLSKGLRSRIRIAVGIIQESLKLFIKEIKRIRINVATRITAVAGAAADLMTAVGNLFSLEGQLPQAKILSTAIDMLSDSVRRFWAGIRDLPSTAADRIQKIAGALADLVDAFVRLFEVEGIKLSDFRAFVNIPAKRLAKLQKGSLEIPRTMVALLHAGEMVLPRTAADPVRDILLRPRISEVSRTTPSTTLDPYVMATAMASALQGMTVEMDGKVVGSLVSGRLAGRAFMLSRGG